MVKISETFNETITIKNQKNPGTNLGIWYVNEKLLLLLGCYIPDERFREVFK